MTRDPRRIAAVALAVVLSFGALYAGDAYYTRLTVGGPLERVFREAPSVLSYEIDDGGPGVVVKVMLGDVADLRREVLSLEERAAAVLRGRAVEIRVMDTRDERLSAAYYSMHFYIQEALVTGRFSDMKGEIARAAAEAGLDRHRVFVDERCVYVQLHLGGRYLYEVVPRGKSGRPSAGGEG